MQKIVRTYGLGLLVAPGDTVHGQSAAPASGDDGNLISVVGGDGDGAGSGGAVSISSGSPGASGPGEMVYVAASGGVSLGGDVKISTGAATGGPGGNVAISLGEGTTSDGYVDIIPQWSGDESPYLRLSASGPNTSNSTQVFTGNRDPGGTIAALAGSIYLRGAGVGSGIYVNNTPGVSPGTNWITLGTATDSGAWREDTFTTTDATVGVTIATPIPTVTDGTQHSVEVLITADAGPGNIYFRRQVFTYYRDGAGAQTWTQETNGFETRKSLANTVTATLAADNNSVVVIATGLVATNISWRVQYRTTNTISNSAAAAVTGIVRETLDTRGSPIVTGSAAGGGGIVDFSIVVGSAYISLPFLRVVTATGTCSDATITFFRDASRTDTIYSQANVDTSLEYSDRSNSALLGDSGAGLEANTLYCRIANNDGGIATFSVEVVSWGA